MMRLTRPRAAAIMLLGAALLSACADNAPTSSSAAPPPGVKLAVIPTSLTSIDLGETHGCGLTSTGQAWCWGRNSTGQLGDSSAATRKVPVQVRQPSGVTFTQVSAGQSHTCALTSGGAAYCWGYNADYRLGDSTFSLRTTPRQVKGATGLSFASISAGQQHTCALTSGGAAYCWGSNAYGQLGNNSTAHQKTPVAVQHPSGVTFNSIATGETFTCALDTGGQAWCWGYGADGAMGGGFTLGDSIPAQVTQPSGVTFASIATYYRHTCAVTSAGQAYCWGENTQGQLGDNSTTQSYVPVAVQQPSGVTFASVTTGWTHSCARTSAGQAYCWGVNNRGQVGDGTTTTRTAPVAVSQPSGVAFSTVKGGGDSNCALDGSGVLWCWGRNDYYQLADETNTDRYAPVTGDAAPTVSSTTPAHNATGVAGTANIVINFSESVTVSTSSFTLSCNSVSQSFSVSGSGTSSITLDPSSTLAASAVCTVTVVANQVSDTDTNDGVDNMNANYQFSFTVSGGFGGEI